MLGQVERTGWADKYASDTASRSFASSIEHNITMSAFTVRSNHEDADSDHAVAGQAAEIDMIRSKLFTLEQQQIQIKNSYATYSLRYYQPTDDS
jgi:hypothetical protein